jgi:hypothetical protein
VVIISRKADSTRVNILPIAYIMNTSVEAVLAIRVVADVIKTQTFDRLKACDKLNNAHNHMDAGMWQQ